MIKLIKKLYLLFASNEQYIKYLRKHGAQIGCGCIIHKSCKIENEGFLIRIGNNVRISEGVHLIPHDGGLWTLRKMGLLPGGADYMAPIEIGNNVHVGNNAFILPGVKIGDNCVVGCCAVVTKSVPPNSVVGGVPAHFIETIHEYYEKKKNIVRNTKDMQLSKKIDCWKKTYKG